MKLAKIYGCVFLFYGESQIPLLKIPNLTKMRNTKQFFTMYEQPTDTWEEEFSTFKVRFFIEHYKLSRIQIQEKSAKKSRTTHPAAVIEFVFNNDNDDDPKVQLSFEMSLNDRKNSYIQSVTLRTLPSLGQIKSITVGTFVSSFPEDEGYDIQIPSSQDEVKRIIAEFYTRCQDASNFKGRLVNQKYNYYDDTPTKWRWRSELKEQFQDFDM